MASWFQDCTIQKKLKLFKLKELNVAVILAAGEGKRSNFLKAKQLVKLGGKTVIEHVLVTFQKQLNIDEIIIVTNPDCLSLIKDIVKKQNFNKVKSVILGGKERHDSSIEAIKSYESKSLNHNVNLIFHDAVRPLVSNYTIGLVIDKLKYFNAVDVACPVTDTIIKSNSLDKTIENIPERKSLYQGQTPQGFKYSTIKQAYDLYLKNKNFFPTDDCGVVSRFLPNEKIYIVDGEHTNLKLTYKDDLPILDKLLQIKTSKILNDNIETSLSKLTDKVIVIIGGNSGIGKCMNEIATKYNANVIVGSRINKVDITSHHSIKMFLKEVNSKYGRIDCIVNTAAILNKKSLNNMKIKEINELIRTNYFGVANLALLSFPYLKATKGQLLNFTSSSYTYGRASYSIYSSTKAAVVNFTQAIADEWNSYDIKVNCINPERTKTAMRENAFGKEESQTLLDPSIVAFKSLLVLVSNETGIIFDIKS